jgi:hypothetical protein
MQQTANLHQLLAAGFDPKSIARAASAITVQGARYREWHEATTGR